VAVVFASLIPVFLLILAGALLRRLLIPDETHWIGVERLVYYVLFPALLIQTLAEADLDSVPFAGIALALATSILLMSALCLALRAPLTRRLNLDGAAFTSVFQGATRWQTFVAIAVADNLYGDAGVALAAVAVVAMIPLLNVINVWVLAHFAAPSRPAWRDVILAIARNPLIWGCVIGGALNLVAAAMPRPLAAVVEWLGRSSLPVGLLLVGSGLNIAALLRPRPATFIATSLKLVVMPVLAVVLGGLLGLRGTSLVVVACCASVPSASNAYVLARQMGGDAALMAEILTLQTLVAIVTMPIAIAAAEAAAIGR
jgi:malonate transporter